MHASIYARNTVKLWNCVVSVLITNVPAFINCFFERTQRDHCRDTNSYTEFPLDDVLVYTCVGHEQCRQWFPIEGDTVIGQLKLFLLLTLRSRWTGRRQRSGPPKRLAKTLINYSFRSAPRNEINNEIFYPYCCSVSRRAATAATSPGEISTIPLDTLERPIRSHRMVAHPFTVAFTYAALPSSVWDLVAVCLTRSRCPTNLLRHITPSIASSLYSDHCQ